MNLESTLAPPSVYPYNLRTSVSGGGNIHFPTATRRLFYDLRELKDSAVSRNITAHPLDQDIYKWHGNILITAKDSSLTMVLHFLLLFPTDYPQKPPSILLTTPLPHPNVHRTILGYKVCLDMLDGASEGPYQGWSQSYTARSILMQLEAFMRDPKELYNPHIGTLDMARMAAEQTSCNECGHSAQNVWPPWPKESEVQQLIKRAFQRPLPPTKRGSLEWNISGRAARNVPEVLPTVFPSHGLRKKFDGLGEVCVSRLEGLQCDTDSLRFVLPSTARRMGQVASYPIFQDQVTDLKPQVTITAPPFNTHYPCERSNAGQFSKLPSEIVYDVLLCGLSAHDIRNFAATCRFLRLYGFDGHCWKVMYNRSFPQSELRVDNIDDWMHAFTQESNFSGDDLKCYYTKASWREDVLGFPITFTQDPESKEVDYVHTEVEFLSRTAYKKEKCRTTVWNHKFKTWCPAYISEEHFRRGFRDIMDFMIELSPQYNSSTFMPRMALEVLGKAMNTCATLLMDGGVAASSKAIEGYFQLHRLLLAMVENCPYLENKVDMLIDQFIQYEGKRHQSVLTSLNNFFPLITVSKKFSAKADQFYMLSFKEWLDREIPVLCGTKCPKLGELLKSPNLSPEQELEAIQLFNEHTMLQRRLFRFHRTFSMLIRDGTTLIDLRNQTDKLWGHPPKKAVDFMQKAAVYIRNGLNPYIKEDSTGTGRTRLLKYMGVSMANAIRRGYDKNEMNISPRSISTIILRGQSYSAPPDLKRLILQQTWRWDPRKSGGNMCYLDATCSVYDFNNRLVSSVDYNPHQRRWKGCAIHHFGDQMTPTLFHGRHEIKMDISQISVESVKALVFCASGWNCQLGAFKSPEMRLHSPHHEGEGGELYRYAFSQTRGAVAVSSIVLCILWRRNMTANWELKPIGHLGHGRASQREFPLLESDMQEALKQLN